MAFKWTGLNELQEALYERTNLEAVKMVVKKNGAQLQQKAQRNTPVGTPASTGIKGYVGGTLRRSEILEIEDGGMTAAVQAHANYAPYVEFGTRFMEGRHYMKKAFDAQIPIFKSDLNKLVR